MRHGGEVGRLVGWLVGWLVSSGRLVVGWLSVCFKGEPWERLVALRSGVGGDRGEWRVLSEVKPVVELGRSYIHLGHRGCRQNELNFLLTLRRPEDRVRVRPGESEG